MKSEQETLTTGQANMYITPPAPSKFRELITDRLLKVSPPLSYRDINILLNFMTGYTKLQVANKLGISTYTVYRALRRLFKQFKVRNLKELIEGLDSTQ